MDVLDRLGVDVPIVQAGMGGGVSTGGLAGAVSAAGGLGTVGIVQPGSFGREIAQAREIAGDRAVAANLLLPFVDAGHVRDVLDSRPDVVVLFFGHDPDLVERLHDASILVLRQVGTPEETRQAAAEGVDGFIAQGREAGGHLRGVTDTAAAVEDVRGAAGDRPVLAAGGVAERSDVERLLAAGADAVAVGTRFLLTEESRAHPAYKRRLLRADRTLETDLFGFGWPARHRVVENVATRRWNGPPGGPLVRAFNRATAPVAGRMPASWAPALTALQRPWSPVLLPQPPVEGMHERLVDVTPLYAGEGVARIGDVLPAAEVVRRLSPSRP